WSLQWRARRHSARSRVAHASVGGAGPVPSVSRRLLQAAIARERTTARDGTMARRSMALMIRTAPRPVLSPHGAAPDRNAAGPRRSDRNHRQPPGALRLARVDRVGAWTLPPARDHLEAPA